jgi:hypothetical protein
VGNRLHIANGATSRRAEGFDYCLLALEHAGSLFARGEGSIKALASLPFDGLWRDAIKLLALNKAEDANQALLSVRAAVVTSPDLIEEDRLLALAAYNNTYSKFQQQLMPPAPVTKSETRGASSAPTVEGLKAEAQVQTKSGQSDVAQVLDLMALSQQMIAPEGPPDRDKPERTMLAEAMRLRKELRQKGITPTLAITSRLAEALSLAASSSE